MDELQISGKRFISARRIAKENGYTSDYIGQLIRGGKIHGQKVGRAWYVDAVSFDAYLGGGAKIPSTQSESLAPIVDSATAVTSLPRPEMVPVVDDEAKEKVEEKVKEDLVLKTSPNILAVEAIEPETPVVEDPAQQNLVSASTKDEATNYVPLHIYKHQDKKTKKEISGLRYIADDSSSVPEISNKNNMSRYEGDAHQDIEQGTALQPKKEKSFIRGLKATLGVSFALLVLVASVFISNSIVLKLHITSGNNAAASYQIGW